MKQEQPISDEKVISSHSISRMSFGLFIAALVLVVPLIMLVYLYLTEINREITLLDRQVKSIRVMQQFVALQINMADEYYGRFYPSNQALAQFSEPDNPIDTSRSRAEPVALLNTQFSELDTELKRSFSGDFRTWPVIKNQLLELWQDEVWQSNFNKLRNVDAPAREFVNDLFFASNLDLSSSEQIRSAAHLLFVDIGQSKFSIFSVTEQLALLTFSLNEPTEEDVRLLVAAMNKIYSFSMDSRAMQMLGDSDLFSVDRVATELSITDVLEMAKRLLEKKRRLQFLGVLEGDIDDMGLAIEIETLRGLTWEKFNGLNRVQIQLARFLEGQLSLERESISQWRTLMLIMVSSFAVFGVLLGAYIVYNIRNAQNYLGSQNVFLEETVKSRTEEIVSAKNEAEQLNRILGKQTQISTELARKAEQASSAKSLFLAAMSHEIRTPLNAVLGGANILGKTKLDSRQKGILNLITQSGKTLLDLINEILDFSKIEAGQLHLESIAFDLESEIIGIVSMFSLKAKEKDIYLRLFIDSSIEGQWQGDPLRVKQILINLLSNAIKFTHIGGISVRVTLNDQSKIAIAVHDTGIGIKSDHLKHLFEAFVQSDSSTTRKYGGTGLGLSISKRLAELQHGDISVESALGRGSNFLLTLPLKKLGDSIQISARTDLDVGLLSSNPELERRLRQWYGHVTIFEDINHLIHYVDALPTDQEHPLVIVAESTALMSQHDQWAQGTTQREVARLDYPWVLLTSQDAIDCEDSEQLSQQLKALGANIQLPLFSTGALIRQAIERAYKGSKNVHENWVGDDVAIESVRYRGRVLLVEDVYFNRVIAKELLESYGLIVESAENGLQAVDFMEHIYNLPDKNQLPITLILMDLHMPEMNGLDAARRIREIEKHMRLPATPIVAMTADVLLETRDDIVKVGMNGYLPKPFEETELHAVLSIYFDSIRANDNVTSVEEAPIDAVDVVDQLDASKNFENIVSEVPSLVTFDHQALSRRLRGRVDRMAELTQSFLASLPASVATITQLAEARDFKALVFAAHTLKGSAANLGATQLQHTAARIERFGKQLEMEIDELDLLALHGVVDTLDAVVRSLTDEIEAWLRNAATINPD